MAERKDFTEASVVRLKTGGPFMVVENTRSDEAVACAWFSGETVCRDAFHYLALDIIPDSVLKPPIYALPDIASGLIAESAARRAGHITWLSDEEFYRQTVEAH